MPEASFPSSLTGRRAPPWWLTTVSVSFLAYFGLLLYCDLLGSEMIGVVTEFSGGAKVVCEVHPGSAAERVGLRRGDRILSVDSRRIRSLFDWIPVRVNLEVGRPFELDVERGARRLSATLVLERAGWSHWTSREGLLLLSIRGAQLVTLLLALVIAFSQPYALVGRLGAWLLATVATLSLVPPYGMAATWRSLPLPLSWLLWIPLISTLVFAPLFFTFFSLFPRRLFRARWVWYLVWAPVLVELPALARYSYQMVYARNQPPDTPAWVLISSGAAVPVYILGGLIVLIVNYRCLEDAYQRRRVRVMVVGTVLGWLSILPGFLYWWGPTSGLAPTVMAIPGLALAVGLFLAFPVSFAYAIIRYRVLEIPVLLRRSARYVLVVRGFVTVAFLLGAAATLIFVRLYTRLAPDNEAGKSVGLAAGVAFGMTMVWVGARAVRQITQRIDRAFFRAAYDARRILEALADKARTARTRQELVELLTLQVSEALHPRTLAVYLEGDPDTLVLAGARDVSGPDTLPTASPLLEELSRRGQPWEVTPAQSMRGGFSLLAALQPECLVPIAGRDGRPAGLLVLGPRRSEEPYSGQDKRLLASAASQVGVALESIRLAEERVERIEVERQAARELEIARQVQAKLFPQKRPLLRTLEYAGTCLQARAVGGDYYDFLDLGSGRLALVLADISGKGISAALLMSHLQANLRGQYALALKDPRLLLRSVNRLFCDSTAPEHYATLFFASYEDERRLLRYVNCGHNPPLLRRASGELERLPATATVLGMFEAWDCGVNKVLLEPGDTLLAYSDGVTEAADGDGLEFGEERLVELMARAAAPEALVDSAVSAVRAFSRREQADDLTLVAARARV